MFLYLYEGGFRLKDFGNNWSNRPRIWHKVFLNTTKEDICVVVCPQPWHVLSANVFNALVSPELTVVHPLLVNTQVTIYCIGQSGPLNAA
jgi:hypothetical protein